jgi:hypothetical protein
VTNTTYDGVARTVTFASGVVLDERIVDIDDKEHRVSWTVLGNRFEHHNGSMQVFADGDGSRLVWITDLLPDEAAAPISAVQGQGMAP